MRIASSIVLGLLLFGAASMARAQTSPPPPPCAAPYCAPARAIAPVSTSEGRWQLARGVAIFGVVSAGLSLAGAVTWGVLDDRGSERIARGALLGLTLVSTPVVAFSALSVRRDTRVKGSGTLQGLGWIAYGTAVANDAFMLHQTLQKQPPGLGLSILGGVLSAFAVSCMAFDAYRTSRTARAAEYSFALGPRAASLTVRF